MVLLSRDGAYEALTHDGRTVFRRTGPGPDGYELVAATGTDPLADQSTDKFAPLDDELAHKYPSRDQNAYPFAYDTIAQLFDHPAAPDLCVIHSAAHNWEDQGGHRGEHGSPGVVQARAPFVIAGKGVRQDGLVPRAGRLVDVAPTIAHLLGCTPRDDDGTYLAGQDGEVRLDVLDVDAGRPRHVVGFLFDGTNPNVLYDMAARGEAPNVARLMAMGTAFEHGAMAGLPTVTLANHTSILTGRLPGHHGILNNAWFDRATGEQIITNSSATWPWAMQTITPGTESVHDAVNRTLGRRAVGVGQRALRHRRGLLHLRLLPPRRRPADPGRPAGPAPHHGAFRAPVEGLLVVVGRGPHGHRAGVRDLERSLPRRRLPRRRASCGSTSR